MQIAEKYVNNKDHDSNCVCVCVCRQRSASADDDRLGSREFFMNCTRDPHKNNEPDTFFFLFLLLRQSNERFDWGGLGVRAISVTGRNEAAFVF